MLIARVRNLPLKACSGRYVVVDIHPSVDISQLARCAVAVIRFIKVILFVMNGLFSKGNRWFSRFLVIFILAVCAFGGPIKPSLLVVLKMF